MWDVHDNGSNTSSTLVFNAVHSPPAPLLAEHTDGIIRGISSSTRIMLKNSKHRSSFTTTPKSEISVWILRNNMNQLRQNSQGRVHNYMDLPRHRSIAPFTELFFHSDGKKESGCYSNQESGIN